MDGQIFNPIYNDIVPKFNPQIAGGLATEYIKHAPKHIDKVWRCAEKDLPEGLEYLGYEMCTPLEAYNVITRRKKPRRQYETATSNVFMVKYLFKYKGQPFPPIYQQMLIPGQSGLVPLRGALHAINPVITDKAISVGVNNIFIPLTRAKLKFDRVMQYYLRDGAIKDGYVVWSQIYRSKTGAVKPTVKANSTLPHYLFSKYGLGEAFQRFANANVVVGDAETINDSTYPSEEWYICESTRVPPKNHGATRNAAYTPSDIRLAVKRSEWTFMVEGMVLGFFYVVDYFPQRVTPENVNDTRIWKVLMGHINNDSTESEGLLINTVDTHLESLDTYVDALVSEDLLAEGLQIADFYELLAELIESFPKRVLDSAQTVSSMYDKQLRVLRYVCLPIVKDIFNFVFELRKKTKPNLTADDIIKVVNHNFKTERIMKVTYKHPEVRSVSIVSDNPLFAVTLNAVLQTNSTGSSSKSKQTTQDPSTHLHASMSEVSGYLNISKAEPSGRSRLNPYVAINEQGVIVRKPHMQKMIDAAQEIIKR
jgi:hypothetical protein